MQHFCVSSRSYTIDRESSRQPPGEDKSRNREAVSDIALPFELEDVAGGVDDRRLSRKLKIKLVD